MVGWLYSMRSATLRVVTACQPSSAAICRAAERMLCRISCRSRSLRCLIPIVLCSMINFLSTIGIINHDRSVCQEESEGILKHEIVYTNYILRNDDGSRSQESERHRVIVWGMHAEKAARLLRKGSKIRVQGRMTYPTWKDKQSGATRYGAEIVAQTLDYQGAADEDNAQAEQPAVAAPAPQPV